MERKDVAGRADGDPTLAQWKSLEASSAMSRDCTMRSDMVGQGRILVPRGDCRGGSQL